MKQKDALTTIMLIPLFICGISSFAEGGSEDQKTQMEFAVQLCKVLDLEVGQEDYVSQLELKGIFPEGGWQPDKPMNNKEMADILARSLGLKIAMAEKPATRFEEVTRNKATILQWWGKVQIKMGEEESWISPKKGMKLSGTDSVRTGLDAWIDLRIGLVGMIKIKGNSEINLTDLSFNADRSQNVSIYLLTGEIIVDARTAPKGSDVKVRTPTTVAAVRGTIYQIRTTGENTKVLKAT